MKAGRQLLQGKVAINHTGGASEHVFAPRSIQCHARDNRFPQRDRPTLPCDIILTSVHNNRFTNNSTYFATVLLGVVWSLLAEVAELLARLLNPACLCVQRAYPPLIPLFTTVTPGYFAMKARLRIGVSLLVLAGFALVVQTTYHRIFSSYSKPQTRPSSQILQDDRIAEARRPSPQEIVCGALRQVDMSG